jgi:type VI secretion system protein ImpL
MQRFWKFCFDTRSLAVLGLVCLVTVLGILVAALDLGVWWLVGALALLLLGGLLGWWYQRRVAQLAGEKLEEAVGFGASAAIMGNASKERRDEMRAVREQMRQALHTIKTSKLGMSSGSAALYELPWYAIIGNPAAGKSSAVVRSGLNFPFPDKATNVLQGIGGTRHCDWFFTTEGVLLDTAGRYSVQDEDNQEWLGFLELLKRYRPKAPLNGVVIAASLSELAGNPPEFGVALAKKLRARVQELTERLEILVPVYVMFTKADLVCGFVEFFEDQDPAQRERIWGATLPLNMLQQPGQHAQTMADFEQRFGELHDGLKAVALERMEMLRGQPIPAGLLTFPLEFAALRPQLRSFLSTLFEDNPYQYRALFRGFYFTSAVQENSLVGQASQRVASRFGLRLPQQQQASSVQVVAQHGFFLHGLFSKVIFADRHLVRQYASPHQMRWRYAAFFGGVLLLAIALAGWTYSYVGNQQLALNVSADLARAVKLQDGRLDLQSRLQALEVLQDRLEQLEHYRVSKPWGLGLGLHQGRALEAKVRLEYFAGLRSVMLEPTTSAISGFLKEVNSNSARLQPMVQGGGGTLQTAPVTSPQPAAGVYVSASSSNVSDAYNALKTYIMLGDHAVAEAGHMNDQVTRFWRSWLETNRGAMSKQELIRSAEKILSFAMTQINQPNFPSVDLNLALLDSARENLRRVVKGMPARERVYAEIKARAALRYPAVTVARLVDDVDKQVVVGSYALSGAFTVEAWKGFIEDAFKDAATKESRADDWVLKTAIQDDLTLEGSPEQIRKSLTQLYKTEYVQEWQKFMAGIGIKEFASFDDAVHSMNRLGDPQASPIGRLLQVLYVQTSWDNPGVVKQVMAQSQTGFVAWFKEKVLRMAPGPLADVKVEMDVPSVPTAMGPIGKEFSGLQRLMAARDNAPNLMQAYLAALSKVRTRFNLMQNQGDPGPASRQLMAQTLEGSSEISEALKLVDEQMLTSQTPTAKAAMRPLLVRPLMQSFAVIVAPAESEINRVWVAQVHQPFSQILLGKYPFDANSGVQASTAEISKFFGPEGSISKFGSETLGPLVVRHGDKLTARSWADFGLRLRPELMQSFPVWVEPLGAAESTASSTGSGMKTSFQILPIPTPGMLEYTLEIDGQKLRYQNQNPTWQNFVWPAGQGAPGVVRIQGVTTAGQSLDFVNEIGIYGLEKMVASAARSKKTDGSFELRWGKEPQLVAVQFRTTSSPNSSGQMPSASKRLLGLALPASVVGKP